MFSGPVRYTVDVVDDDPDAQVAHTIGLMRRYAAEDARRPLLIDTARHITVGAETERERIERVWAWVKRRLEFIGDERAAAPLGLGGDMPVVETLMRPTDMVSSGMGGDCDDYSMLAACLLKCLGIRSSFATVGADRDKPNAYSHVYVVAYTKDGERVAVDASHGAYCGWEAPNDYGKFAEWPLDGGLGAVVAMAALIGALGVWAMGGLEGGD